MTLIAAAAVPLLVAPGTEQVFALPKLVALWMLLFLCWCLMGADVLLRGRRRLWGRPRPVDVAMMVALAIAVVATVLSVDPWQSVVGERLQYQGTLTWLLYAGWFALARVLFDTPKRLALLVAAVCSGALAVAGLALGQKVGFDPMWDGYLPGGRVYATVGQSNALGAYLATAVPCALALAAVNRGLRRAWWIATASVVAAAVVPTMSRGGYFALAAGLCTLGIAWMFSSRPRQRDNRKFLGWSVGLLLAALVLVALPGTRGLAVASWDRVETLGSAGRDESVVAHFDQWKVAAHIVVDHPLIGTGPSTLPTVFPSYSREVLEDDRVVYFDQFRVESAHNGMLDLATAGGLPLLLACAGVLLTAAWELARDVRSSGCQLRARLSAGLLAALATFVVANSFMTAEVTGSWVLWLMLGAATGSRRTRTGSASPLPTPR